MIFRTYKNSFLASMISLFGSGFIFGGLYMITSGELGGAIAMIVVGLICVFGASAISNNKAFKAWVKGLKEKGILDQLATSDALCKQVYQANPKKQTIKLIEKYNTRVADELYATSNKK